MRRTRWLALGAVSILLYTACTWRPFLPDPDAETGATVLVGESVADSLIVEVYLNSGLDPEARALVADLAAQHDGVGEGDVRISGINPETGVRYLTVRFKVAQRRDLGPRTVDAANVAVVVQDHGYRLETLYWCPPTDYEFGATPEVARDEQGYGCLAWTEQSGFTATEILLEPQAEEILGVWFGVLAGGAAVVGVAAVWAYRGRGRSRLGIVPVAWGFVALVSAIPLMAGPSPTVAFSLERDTLASWVWPAWLAALTAWIALPVLAVAVILHRSRKLNKLPDPPPVPVTHPPPPSRSAFSPPPG